MPEASAFPPLGDGPPPRDGSVLLDAIEQTAAQFRQRARTMRDDARRAVEIAEQHRAANEALLRRVRRLSG